MSAMLDEGDNLDRLPKQPGGGGGVSFVRNGLSARGANEPRERERILLETPIYLPLSIDSASICIVQDDPQGEGEDYSPLGPCYPSFLTRAG